MAPWSTSLTVSAAQIEVVQEQHLRTDSPSRAVLRCAFALGSRSDAQSRCEKGLPVQ
jgi:hypothetical protein